MSSPRLLLLLLLFLTGGGDNRVLHSSSSSSSGVAAAFSVNGSRIDLLSIPPGYEPRTFPDPDRDNDGKPTT